MIPLKDHNPTTRPSLVVPIFIGINIVMFLFFQPTLSGMNAPPDQRLAQEIRFTACTASIPYEIMNGELVLDAALGGEIPGGGEAGLTIALAQDGFDGTELEGFVEPCRSKNVWLSILTSMFLHGSFAHIGFNMLFLWVFGNNIEDRLGRARFIAFYLLTGIAATYAQALVNPDSPVPLIGASGAIAGVLGAYILLYPRARVTGLGPWFIILELPAVVFLGIWFGLQLLQGVGSVTGDLGGVAYFAHIGGFVAGAVLIKAFRPRPVRPPPMLYG